MSAFDSMRRRDFVARAAKILGSSVSVATLLTTSTFSWLALRETRITRQEQAQYFAAEKPPRIVLQRFEWTNEEVSFILRNEGLSAAFGVRTSIFAHAKYEVAFAQGPKGIFMSTPKVDKTSDIEQRVVHKDQTWVVRTRDVKLMEETFQFHPINFRVTESPHDEYITVNATYADLVENVHSTALHVEARR